MCWPNVHNTESIRYWRQASCRPFLELSQKVSSWLERRAIMLLATCRPFLELSQKVSSSLEWRVMMLVMWSRLATCRPFLEPSQKVLSSLERGGWWCWWCSQGWPPVGHFWNYLKKCRHRWSGGWWCWWCGQGWPCPSPRRTRRTMASPPSSSVA